MSEWLHGPRLGTTRKSCYGDNHRKYVQPAFERAGFELVTGDDWDLLWCDPRGAWQWWPSGCGLDGIAISRLRRGPAAAATVRHLVPQHRYQPFQATHEGSAVNGPSLFSEAAAER